MATKQPKPKPERVRVQDEQLVVRLSAALLERLDGYAERVRADLPGGTFTRADAVRVLLTRALGEVEGTKRTKR